MDLLERYGFLPDMDHSELATQAKMDEKRGLFEIFGFSCIKDLFGEDFGMKDDQFSQNRVEMYEQCVAWKIKEDDILLLDDYFDPKFYDLFLKTIW